MESPTSFRKHAIPFTIVFALVGFAFILFVYANSRSSPPPPGLKALPQPPTGLLGGHLGQFDVVAPYTAFDHWSKQYGPLFQVNLGSQPFVVVSDPVIAKELFEKRGSKYSSRKVLHVAFDLLSRGRRIGFAPSGPMHRAFRKQMQSILSITRGPVNQKIQELESRQVLKDLLDLFSAWDAAPQKDHTLVQRIYQRYTASLMSTMAFGHRIPDINDGGFAKTIFDIMHTMSEVVQPGRYWVDIFPWMKKLPYCMRTWEHEVNKTMSYQWPFLNNLLKRAENQQEMGISNPGLVRALLDQRKSMTPAEQQDAYLDDNSIAFQSMTILEAGSDTTTIGLMNFTLAMLLHPEIQKRAQAIIDAKCPDTRLPIYHDVNELQFVRQIVKEVLRWRPPLPNAIPHLVIEDDEYEGYFIPKGSLVIGNIWTMHLDPKRYPDPLSFNPDRYEGSRKSAFESSNEVDPMNRDHLTFGWGRRICPGLHLAEDSLLLLYTRLLWAFDIVSYIDPQTKQPCKVTADPQKDYDNNIIQSPLTFPVTFRLRSEARGQTINRFHEEALQRWDELQLDLYRVDDT